MKSTIKYFFTLTAIYLLSMGSVFADSEVVIGIEFCSLFDGNGFIQRDIGEGVTVSAQSSNNNTIHKCSADVTPPDSGRSEIFNIDNVEVVPGKRPKCKLKGTEFRTEDWHQVVSASGKAKLVCHFKN
jgi:hypothetical protein